MHEFNVKIIIYQADVNSFHWVLKHTECRDMYNESFKSHFTDLRPPLNLQVKRALQASQVMYDN